MNEYLDPTHVSIGQWLAGLIVAIPLAIPLLMRLWKGFASDKSQVASFNANETVTVGHVREIERLQKLNTYLSDELGKMQQQVTKVATDNIRLQGEITSLQEQLARVLSFSIASTTGAKNG